MGWHQAHWHTPKHIRTWRITCKRLPLHQHALSSKYANKCQDEEHATAWQAFFSDSQDPFGPWSKLFDTFLFFVWQETSEVHVMSGHKGFQLWSSNAKSEMQLRCWKHLGCSKQYWLCLRPAPRRWVLSQEFMSSKVHVHLHPFNAKQLMQPYPVYTPPAHWVCSRWRSVPKGCHLLESMG